MSVRIDAVPVLLLIVLLSVACSNDSTPVADGDLDQTEYAPWERDQEGDGNFDGEPEDWERWEPGDLTYDSLPDATYRQWHSEHFRSEGDTEAPKNVRAIVPGPEGGAYFGGSNGLYFYDPALEGAARLSKVNDSTNPDGVTQFAVQDMAVVDNYLYILASTNTSTSLYRMRYGKIDALDDCELHHAASGLAVKGDYLYIATSGPVYFFNNSTCDTGLTNDWPSGDVRGLDGTDDNKVAIVLRDPMTGDFELDLFDGNWRTYKVEADEDENINGGLMAGTLNGVRYLSNDVDGFDEVWIPGEQGVQMRNQRRASFSTWKTEACMQGDADNCGFPLEDARHIEVLPDGSVWAATTAAVLHYDADNNRWKLFQSRRWLMEGSEITVVGYDAEGDIWIGSDIGLTRLYAAEWILADKAAALGSVIAERHMRMEGLLSICRLNGPGDLSVCEQPLEDNEALYTGMLALADTFRAASATSQADRNAARQSAWASVRMLTELVKATMLEERPEIEGLPARTIMPRGEGPLNDPGAGEWNRSDHYDWKGNPGWENLVGHILAYPFYYDLLATDQEKTTIRTAINRIGQHLLDNDWKHIDVDGLPTDNGHMDSEYVTGNEGLSGYGGIRALVLLSFLRTAYHITGNERYFNAYIERAIDADYAQTTRNQYGMSLTRRDDDQADLLAFLAYLPLLKYADIVSLRNAYLDSLTRAWDDVKERRSPLYNMIYGLSSVTNFRLQASLDELQDWPVDLIDWRIESCERHDVVVRETDPATIDRLLPPDERKLSRPGGNPFVCDWNDPGDVDQVGGMREFTGVQFLLSYWMARYNGILTVE